MVLNIRHNKTSWTGAAVAERDATNTGHSGSLTVYLGPNPVTINDTLIENKTISDGIAIEADNVTIRNCNIIFTGTWGIDCTGSDLTVENCTITGAGASGSSNACILGQGTFRGNNISAAENGMVFQDGNSVFEYNYIHDLNSDAADPHIDGIACQSATTSLLIQYNTVVAWDTSTIFIKPDFGSLSNVTIHNNWLKRQSNGAGGFKGMFFTINSGTVGGQSVSNVVLTDNHIVEGDAGEGYWSFDGFTPTGSGNVDYTTGLPITQAF